MIQKIIIYLMMAVLLSMSCAMDFGSRIKQYNQAPVRDVNEVIEYKRIKFVNEGVEHYYENVKYRPGHGLIQIADSSLVYKVNDLEDIYWSNSDLRFVFGLPGFFVGYWIGAKASNRGVDDWNPIVPNGYSVLGGISGAILGAVIGKLGVVWHKLEIKK